MKRLAVLICICVLASACAKSDTPTDQSADSTTTVTSPATTTTTEARPPGCGTGQWPALVFTEPTKLAAADTTGYYVWNDFTGWHVRFVNADGGTRQIGGRVVSSDRVVSGSAFPTDAAGVTVAANVVTFDMQAAADPVGVDVNVGCQSTTVRFELNGDGGPWPVDSVFLGKDGTAVVNPFVVNRQKGFG